VTRPAIECTCGHALSSHRQDSADPWVTERCKTCGCAGFLNVQDTRPQQSNDDDEFAALSGAAQEQGETG
jgi:hypothetical protein